MDELADYAAALHEESTHLEARLGAATDEIDGKLVELIAAYDQCDRLAASLRRSTSELDAGRIELDEALGHAGELRATIDGLIAEREEVSAQLSDVELRFAGTQHRLLIEKDRAYGFVESLRSVAADFHHDVVPEWLDEDELLRWVEMTSKERKRLDAANADLLHELTTVNEHREELVGDINAICGSESWRIGRAVTWPLRAVFRRKNEETT
jgi:chromosome segregation ATPase